MSVPTFDPKAWALLYFPAGGYPFVSDPEEFFLGPREGGRLTIANSAGDFKTLSFDCHSALLQCVEEALNDDIVVSGGRLFTVHNLGMLQRLINRLALKQKSLGMPAISFRQWDQATDLVEEFHRPAVLTYDARKAFSSGQIREWLSGTPARMLADEPDDTERNTLLHLCRLL